MRYSEETIEEVRQANDIVDVISQYVHLKRSGRNFFGLCPFHNEKSPSFSVSPDKQIFHCFGCGVGGNIFTFLTKIEGITFIEAVQNLAKRANIQLPTIEGNLQDLEREKLKQKVYKINEFVAKYYHENLYKNTSKIAQEYVKKRKLNNETLQSYQIGFSGTFNELYKELIKQGFEEKEILETGLVNKNDNGTFIDRYRNRLMFPICDIRGKVIAFGGRVLDDSKPKYINSPENVVYSKGKHLYGLNVAKKGDISRLLIVEGYMDVISLHQRGITNVVAALGTALTQSQGWLLRKNSQQVILSFDSDGAGQTAIVRSLEILQNMGCDMRVLQMDGAKDPDEYIIKYGSARFQNIMDKALSLVEYKVKLLRNNLNLENINDKIKFLNEIAKIIAKIDNTMEKELYIEKIANTYNISKDAIYAEVNKITYSNTSGIKILEKAKPVQKRENLEQKEKVSEEIKKREDTILSILLMGDINLYQIIKQNIKPEEFQSEIDKEIAKKLYEEYEKGNSNIISIIDQLEEKEQNHITEIMAEDYGIEDIEKAIDDIFQNYEKEKCKKRRIEILKELKSDIDETKKIELENELNYIVLKLAKIK